MKCFIVVAALVASAVAEADPWMYASGAPLLGGLRGYAGLPLGGAIKTIAPLGYAARPALVARPAIAARPIGYAAAPAIAAPAIAAPAVAYAAKAVAPTLPSTSSIVPVAGGIVSSQFHKQDELANYEFGYANQNSARHEAGNAYGGVTGSYSYTDGYGLKQTRNYVADALGFRVVGSDVPAQRLHKRSLGYAAPLNYGLSNYGYGLPAAGYGYAAAAPLATAGYGYGLPAAGYGYAAAAPLAHATYAAAPLAHAGYAAPVAAAVVPSAPAAREAILTKIQLNPGHATAYRVFDDNGAY